MARFEVPDGWCVQAFRFTLDPTEEQAHALARHFGARRKAYNWTVATLKADIEAWNATGIETAKPALRVLRKRWNTVKRRRVRERRDRCGVVAGVLERGLCRRHSRARWTRTGTGRLHGAGTQAGKRVGFPALQAQGP